MATCTINSTKLPTGATGTGVDGNNGNHGGLSGLWTYSTSTASPPGSTEIRFDSATSAAVTTIYVSDTGRSSIDYDLFLDNLSNSSNYGYITIYKEFDPTKFWIGKITGVTDSGAYHTLTVTYISASNATIPTNIYAAADNIVLTFSASGATPSNGSDGTDGTTVLNNATTGSATTSGATNTVLLSYTVTAGQCDTNGDIIQIVGWVEKSSISDDFNLTLDIGSSTFGSFILPIGVKTAKLEATLTRESATTYFFESTVQSFNGSSGYIVTNGIANSYSSGALTFANSQLVELKMQRTSGSGTATAKQLNINFLNKA